MPTPLVRVRLIAPHDQADTLAAAILDSTRELVGPTATYHTRKLPARRYPNHTRVYLTITPQERN